MTTLDCPWTYELPSVSARGTSYPWANSGVTSSWWGNSLDFTCLSLPSLKCAGPALAPRPSPTQPCCGAAAATTNERRALHLHLTHLPPAPRFLGAPSPNAYSLPPSSTAMAVCRWSPAMHTPTATSMPTKTNSTTPLQTSLLPLRDMTSLSFSATWTQPSDQTDAAMNLSSDRTHLGVETTTANGSLTSAPYTDWRSPAPGSGDATCIAGPGYQMTVGQKRN